MLNEAEIKLQLEELEEEVDKLWARRKELKEELQRGKGQRLLEAGVLSKYKWRMSVSLGYESLDATLYCQTAPQYIPEFGPLEEKMLNESIDFDGFYLDYNDEYMSLNFDSNAGDLKSVLGKIKELGLEVELNPQDKYEQLREELNLLHEFIKEVE